MDARCAKILCLAGIDDAKAKAVKVEGTQPHTILKEVVKQLKPSLLEGCTDAEVSQWLTWSVTASGDAAVKYMDDWLSLRSYVAGYSLSLADVAVLECLGRAGAPAVDVTKTPAVARWYTHVQTHCVNVGDAALAVVPVEASVFPVFTTAPQTASAKSSSDAKTTEDGKNADKKDKKDAMPTDPAPAAVAAAVASDEADVSRISFVVGKVVKCWNHEESEKLLCEEVDMGEASTRKIASGIRAFYSAEQVEGRMVIVAANLKPRKIANFASEGMVLCAVNGDHTAVALLEPPTGAEPGQRVTFEGFDGEPATPAQVAKKKLLEKVLPGLKTDAKGTCCYLDKPFTLPTGVVTAASMPDAAIS